MTEGIEMAVKTMVCSDDVHADLDHNAMFSDLGIDSLATVELAHKIGSSFMIDIPPSIVVANPSINALVNAIYTILLDSTQTIGSTQTAERPFKLKSRMAKDTPLTSIIEEDCTPKASLKMMFVLCTPRSGSTLLQMCLRTQKAFFAPQELHLLQFQTMGERARYLEGELYIMRDGLISAVAELQKFCKTNSSA